MDSLGWAVYATPTPQGVAAEVYIGAQPRFRDDFILARIEDFCEALGIDSLGWEEMSEGDLAHQRADEVTVTVQRTRQEEETE